jgi:S-adenosylmethionine decarboxylase
VHCLTRKIGIVLFLFSAFCFSEEPYSFKGKHFIASYCGCDSTALENVDQLIKIMEESVIQTGATILDSSAYIFPGNGLTMIFLLQESHASIHTYPEHQACFIDLFTCGDHCSYEKFHECLSFYLKPTCVHEKVLIRQEHAMEVHDGTLKTPGESRE